MKAADEQENWISDSGLSSSISILYLPKPITIPYTRASGRRVWMRAHWDRAKLQVPCRGSGKASGGGGHGFFVHSAVWMQLEPFPAPWRLSCGQRWGMVACIAFANEVFYGHLAE